MNYSHFIKENRRLNFGISYFNSKNDGQSNSLPYETKTRGYGASVGYGILFPLLKKFYAEVTPSVNYSYGRNIPQFTNANASIINNSYATNLTGGVLWMPFKHFGLSANLAALSLAYSKYKTTETSNNQTTKNSQSSFSFNNQGSLQNQTYSIFYKF